MQLTDAEKLILAMLCDISEHLKVQSDIDPKLVKAAVWGDKMWEWNGNTHSFSKAAVKPQKTSKK
jgi:hypothetical protein